MLYKQVSPIKLYIFQGYRTYVQILRIQTPFGILLKQVLFNGK